MRPTHTCITLSPTCLQKVGRKVALAANEKTPNGYAAHSVTAAEASPVFRDARLLLSVPFLIRAQE